jgi:ATP-dependent DNA helicase RecG
MTWIQEKLQVAYIIEGTGPRKEVWEIPLTVFKEAIINALSHRDYYEQGAATTIEVFDDRVEITNPGGLLLGVAKDFGTKSMSRNPLIFGLFTRMHLVERIASGVPRMREAMREANLPEPVFHTTGMFTIIFLRPAKNDTANDTANLENDTANSGSDTANIQTCILELINNQPGLLAPDISKKVSKSLPTIKRHLGALKKAGLIEFKGAAKNGGYYLTGIV